jgi:hypothetical protein
MIQYRLDGGAWSTIDWNSSSTAVGTTWNTFSFNISTAHVNKVDLKISGESIPNGNAFVDNLIIWGIDSSISAIPNISESSLRVYPNPVANTLFIDGDDVKKVEVYDMRGRLAFAGSEKTINVSGLASGMYIVKLHTAKGVFSSKVFKK